MSSKPFPNMQNKNRVAAFGALLLTKAAAGATLITSASNAFGLYLDSNSKLIGRFAGVYASIARLMGIVPAARLDFATDASDADTITIGGKTFKFLTTLIAADTTVQVKRGTSAAATLAALIKAINGTTSAAEWVEATTPFAVAIVADAVTATKLRIRAADARGGNAIAKASGSVALAEGLTPAASIWNCANLNVSGKEPADGRVTQGQVTITAAMITNGSFQVELPFTPTSILWDGYTSAGVKRAISEAVTISANAINLALAGGASPNWQATDVFSFRAVE